MRTDTEILDRIEEVKSRDVLGFERTDLLCYLSFEKVKPFLKEEAQEKPEEWTPSPKDRDALLKEMLEYMPFAWEKANSCRGISAARSLSRFMAWVWLAEDDLGDLSNYEFYGKDHLAQICEHYGWDHTQWDDSRRTNSELG